MNMHVARTSVRVPSYAAIVEKAWSEPHTLQAGMTGPVADAVAQAMAGLDAGTLRVAEPVDGT